LPPERCLFIGDPGSSERLRTIFERHDLAAELVERVDVDVALGGGIATDVRGEQHPLVALVARAGAHRVIIGPHNLANATTFELVETARAAGTRVSLLPDMLEVVGSSVEFDDLYGLTLLGVRHTDLSRSCSASSAPSTSPARRSR